MKIANQNNYPNDLLGYGTGTIKSWGCTLASLGSISNIEILKLNGLLKGSSFSNSAFAGSTKNLINWTQLNKYTNGVITHIWRGYGYDSTKINEAISKHGFCLVEVLNGGTKHWIVAIGNQKALDPLTGGEISTSKYPNWTGWSELKVVEGETDMTEYKGYDLDNKESMKVAIDLLIRVQNGEYVKKEDYKILVEQLKDCQKLEKITKIDSEVKVAEKTWEINGVQVDSDGKTTANYTIKK